MDALDRRLLLGLSAAKLLIHLLLAGRYGYFREELYYLDCGRHLDWGSVDHAPMIGLVARLGSPPGRLAPRPAGSALGSRHRLPSCGRSSRNGTETGPAGLAKRGQTG